MMLSLRALARPHRVLMIILGVALIYWCVVSLRWDWIQEYWDSGMILEGLKNTLWIWAVAWSVGLFLAIWLGLAQAAGPWYLAVPAKAYCSVIRGTPLLLQLWALYYGLGSFFPQFPWLRSSFLWPYLREAWPFAVLALTLSFAGYEGEVMRGAFLGVPKGQLEAARAFGMPRLTALRRIWFPQAFQRALPTVGNESVLLMKGTALVATVTVIDIFAVADQVRSDTFIIYEPLLLLAAAYMVLTGILVLLFRYIERLVPNRVA
ncbi:ABC transporter permease [Mesorhizobium sp. CO1-1-8]|uniref:ABC transporter permease n=1 Tax=Mesorhizobium sp. CO1-1-8 TaxID=2876631 RepID=UPI001CD0EA10|nr:ABC transporter permease [Mesorhizobium sp. CO1-1-8]MBZ9772240.1 ABC transporter permease [Mesorhizobium sp. CO1-1-8]